MAEVPVGLLNESHRRVQKCTLSGKPYFDRRGAMADLQAHKLPAYFIDFETIQFAVPIWKGTRPYQQIPFQFSVQRLSRNGTLVETQFLDLSGDDPSRPFAEALIKACGQRGPVFVYNAAFETRRIKELAQRFPDLSADLLAINERIIDLLPVARARYYHPSQQGSWSIKQVLPALVPNLSYDRLGGTGWRHGHGSLRRGHRAGYGPKPQGRDRTPVTGLLRPGYLWPGAPLADLFRATGPGDFFLWQGVGERRGDAAG